MSKKVKDHKFELSMPNAGLKNGSWGFEEGGWVAHDVSPSGQAALLLKPASAYDTKHREFLLINIQPDGHATKMVVSAKSMQWISFCNFLPDGDILAVGLKGNIEVITDIYQECYWSGGGTYGGYIPARLESGAFELVCCILDGSTLRPVSEMAFEPDSDVVRGLLNIYGKESSVLEHEALVFGEGPCKVDITYVDQEAIGEDWFDMRIRAITNDGPYEEAAGTRIGRLTFKKDLTEIAMQGEWGSWSDRDEWVRALEKRTEITPPLHYPGRNWRHSPHLVEYTSTPSHPDMGYQEATAMLYSAGRKIFVSKALRIREGSETKWIRHVLEIALNFGQNTSSPMRLFSMEYANDWPGLGGDNISMAFTEDASRLTVLSYLPYGKMDDYRWVMHSYDVDGRFREIERTKKRKEGDGKRKAQRVARADSLTKAGLPSHIARLISLHGIDDKKGIELFHYLRSGGAPNVKANQQDPLEKIDNLVFSGRLSKEEGRWLIDNREHLELIEAIIQGAVTIERARYILIDRGFASYPKAVIKVVEGAELETVAMVFGIDSETETGTEGGIDEQPPATTEEDIKPKKKGKGFFRRGSRFS